MTLLTNCADSFIFAGEASKPHEADTAPESQRYFCAQIPGVTLLYEREGGEYNTLRGNKPACLRQVSNLPLASGSSKAPCEWPLKANEEGIQMTALLSISDINTEINHEPRMLDVRLAEALEFNRPRKIRELIKRHSNALAELGEIHDRPTVGRGKEYWLTKKQALYLCTKSETPNATEVTIQMVDVFDQVTNGKTVTVKSHVRRLPVKSSKPRQISAEQFASWVPAEDLLISAEGHICLAMDETDHPRATRHLDIAKRCVRRFHQTMNDTGLMQAYRAVTRQMEGNQL